MTSSVGSSTQVLTPQTTAAPTTAPGVTDTSVVGGGPAQPTGSAAAVTDSAAPTATTVPTAGTTPAPTAPTSVDRALAGVLGADVTGGGAVTTEDPSKGIPAFVRQFLDAEADGSLPSAASGVAQHRCSTKGGPPSKQQNPAVHQGAAYLGCCPPACGATPGQKPSAKPPAKAGGAGPVQQDSDRPRTYTVKQGDWLSKIAPRFGLTWQQLYRANRDRISNPNVIYAGQTLRIPAVHGDKPVGGGTPPVKQQPGGTKPPKGSTKPPVVPTAPTATPPKVPKPPVVDQGAAVPPAAPPVVTAPATPKPPKHPASPTTPPGIGSADTGGSPTPPPIPDTSSALPPTLP